MKINSQYGFYSRLGSSPLLIFLICVFALSSSSILAQTVKLPENSEAKSSVAMEVEGTKIQLIKSKKQLNYPNSVDRFYKLNNYRLAWIAKENHSNQLDPAMMLLNCVLQFGLSNQDFHPTELVYKQIQMLTEHPDRLGVDARARFDVLLTDAIITFINQLHYGKFNTYLTPAKIDSGGTGDLDAVARLKELFKSLDFYTNIIKVQPDLKEYDDLQKHMHLVRGQYIEDNYEFAEESVRKMAINMERLRWLSSASTPNLLINIPACTARLKLKDSTYFFRVIVGKPSSPTQTVESSITYFTVSPDRKLTSKFFKNELLPKALNSLKYLKKNHYAIYDAKGKFVAINKKKLLFIKANPNNYFARQSLACEDGSGKIAFHFAHSKTSYLSGSPQPKLFLLPLRSITNGCIQIDQIEKIAELLLTQDGAAAKIPLMRKSIKTNQKRDFLLKTPVKIKLVYLTCEMIDSQLIIYKDIYGKDAALETAMYGNKPVIVLR